MTQNNLPFKVGQKVEVKSFKSGCRGAWFRCKIKEISQEKGQVLLEHFASPDEETRWTRLYQKSPTDKLSTKRYLMVRPYFPPVYPESQILDISTISEVIAVVDGTWMVGDLVDWWNEDCYWSARITHILDDDNVQIELPEPPMGEGSSHEASCNDLRPSLDWSPEHGWTVPIYEESETCRSCARLIHPKREVVPYLIHSSDAKGKMSFVDSTLLPPNDPPEFSSWSWLDSVDPDIPPSRSWSWLDLVDPDIHPSRIYDDSAFSIWDDFEFSTDDEDIEEKLGEEVLSKFDQKIKDHIIERLEDVARDGHCGYRCCAEMLDTGKDWKDIRTEMLMELLNHEDLYMTHLGGEKRYKEVEKALYCFRSSCTADYWMRFPDMGLLFATTFNCVLSVLSPSQYNTYLPLRERPPGEFKIITLVLHDEKHFLKAFLKPGAPIPKVVPGWDNICDPAALEWEPRVFAKFIEWESLIGYPPIGFSSDHNMQFDFLLQ